jgi:hypothetical protein
MVSGRTIGILAIIAAVLLLIGIAVNLLPAAPATVPTGAVSAPVQGMVKLVVTRGG